MEQGLEAAQSNSNNGHRRKAKSLAFSPYCKKFAFVRNRPFSFNNCDYLIPIYEEPHPYEIFRKAAQVRISTKVILEAIWLADKYGAKILYYLATDKDAFGFSNDRIKPIIDDSNHFKNLLDERDGGVDNVGMKHLAKGTFYCRGLYTRTNVKSVDADVLILDELDEADQDNRRFAYDRILASDLQYVRELSQPSIPDYGVDEKFDKTDQRYYHLKCPSCGDYTCLDLDHISAEGRLVPRHILEISEGMRSLFSSDQQYYRACKHCQKPLDMAQGEWVALYPSREERRGYHLSQLFRQQPMIGHADPADWIMEEILSARKTSEKLRTAISILGYPYAGERAPITDEVLDAAEGPLGFLRKSQKSYIGYDQGDELHIVVLQDHDQKPQVIHMENTSDWSRLPILVQQFKATCLVGDALPNKKTAKDVNRDCEALVLDKEKPQIRCKAYIQYFSGETQKKGEEGEDDLLVKKVGVDRTESLDDTAGLLRHQEMLLPQMALLDGADSRTNDEFRKQLKMLVKDLVEDAAGVKRWKYKTNVSNHYGMALNSARIARELAPITTEVVVLPSGSIMP
tara:strand:- start:10086 stop:11798 length:1713 start_codon:yes stop_codon:yes gene_type:complete